MTQSFSDKQDYVFGQAIFSLRTRIGLTQTDLAERLGVSRKAIGRWEAGSNYLNANHLKLLLELAVKLQAFRVGHEEEDIKALWKIAHQRVPFDDLWLQDLLNAQQSQNALLVSESADTNTANLKQHVMLQSVQKSYLYWEDAPTMPTFYGREEELILLNSWVMEEHCRVVSVLGMGGVGKSALVVTLMHQVARHFEIVIWRSVRDAPTCETLLDDCLRVFDIQPLRELSNSLEGRLQRLMEVVRKRRVLLVLDNLEMLLEEGADMGHMRAGFEGYARLLQRMAETAHQSCLLITSREKLAVLIPLEGNRSPVRTLRLSGLDARAGAQLLREKDVVGSLHDQLRLVELYQGNPLALKIVAQTIVDLFKSEIAPFLKQGEVVFGEVRELLDEQFNRLSALEQSVLFWLAILREPVSLEQLLTMFNRPRARVEVIEAVDRLRRRSLIEGGQHAGSFTLQSVVMEYATGRLIASASREIEQGKLVRLIEHSLQLATVKEYILQTQQRLLVAPLLAQMRTMYSGQMVIEEHLLTSLSHLRKQTDAAQGYGPTNLLVLLRELRGDLRGLDLSQLFLRGAYLQGVELQDVNLSGSLLRECVFTETFDSIWAVAVSPSGQYWAAGSKRGEMWVWREAGRTSHLIWQAHADIVVSLAFSPNEHSLVSGSLDGTIKLWEIETSTLLWSVSSMNSVLSLAFAPDGLTLASGGNQTAVRLWDSQHGTALQDMPHPDPVFSLAWSPDGRTLATGALNGQIRIWQKHLNGSIHLLQMLSGHSGLVRGLAFAPDGRILASASWDESVKLWEVREKEDLLLRQTLVGHTGRMQTVAWSPDGRTLASGGGDYTIKLWDAQQGSARMTMSGHNAPVYSVAYTPDGSLLSGSEDGTLRLWEVERGQCVRVMQGHAVSLYDLDWSPDGTHMVSGGSDTLVTVWDLADETLRKVLRGHDWTVYGVAWSPDGSRIASSGWDNAIRLWDASKGTCSQLLRDHDHPDNTFFGISWSPDGQSLSCGTYQQGVLVWNETEHTVQWLDREHATWIRRVAWSPDGTRVVGGNDDGHVYVWNVSNGMQLLQLSGHHGAVMSVSWHPDGRRLASGGSSKERGELFVWDIHSGQRIHTFVGHQGVVSALTWDPSRERLISGSSDGMVRWWDISSEQYIHAQKAHQGTVQALKVSPDGTKLASCGDDGTILLWDLRSGEQLQRLRRDRPYERLNITGIKGLSEAQKEKLRLLGAFEEKSIKKTLL